MIIELDRVRKCYGPHAALDDLTLSIRPGTIGLLGPNGAGKSTLLKALLGLVRLTSGKAVVLGMDVRRHPEEIRRQIGYMPEDDCIFSGLSGVESVAFAGELCGLPRRHAARRAHEILDYVGIAEERYREVQTYSTGMRQKMKLAQALIHAPKLLFLDEPTSGLDPRARRRMLARIRNLSRNSGMSIVFSTHILHDLEDCCDSVLVLGRGRFRAYERMETLLRPARPLLNVRIIGDREAFLSACREDGIHDVQAGKEADRVIVGHPGDRPGTALFAAAARAGVSIRDLAPSKSSLEDIFHQLVGEPSHADL
jgi:ABC-2 type transport system ATP-binding protein